MKVLYFAYGSNLDWEQMKARCPSSEFACIALLKDHRLSFSRHSAVRNCGVAHILKEKGSDVWGVVYEVSEEDMRVLDTYEGYDPDRDFSENAYNRENIVIYRNGNINESIEAITYYAVPQDGTHIPSAQYKAHIVNGAEHWSLPDEYRAELRVIRTT